jgi:hypothetical protein
MIIWFRIIAFLAAAQFTLAMGKVLNNEMSIWWCLFPVLAFSLSMVSMEQQIEKRTAKKFEKKVDENDRDKNSKIN